MMWGGAEAGLVGPPKSYFVFAPALASPGQFGRQRNSLVVISKIQFRIEQVAAAC